MCQQLPNLSTKRTRKDLFVQRKQFQEGIDLCKTNVANYHDETETLLSKGQVAHGLIFVEFAIEEFGKLMVIEKAFNKNTNDPFRIKSDDFYSHETKSKLAWQKLDTKYKILFDEGFCLPNDFFERGCVVECTLADPECRLRTAFVDYCSSQWLLETNVKSKYLADLVGEIRVKIKNI